MRCFAKKTVAVCIAFCIAFMPQVQVQATETLTAEEITALAGTLNDIYPEAVQLLLEAPCTVVLNPSVDKPSFSKTNKALTITLQKADESFLIYFGAMSGLAYSNITNSVALRMVKDREYANYPGEETGFSGSSNTEWYFGCCFKEYVLHRDRLISACPSSANAVKETLEHIKNNYSKALRYLRLYL